MITAVQLNATFQLVLLCVPTVTPAQHLLLLACRLRLRLVTLVKLLLLLRPWALPHILVTAPAGMRPMPELSSELVLQ